MLQPMKDQMVISDIRDWGTLIWAAEQLGVSEQQVRRYVKQGLLSVQYPRGGSRESGRRLVLVAEVQTFKMARAVVGRG